MNKEAPRRYPFGQPEGSSEDLRNHIKFEGETAWGGLAMSFNNIQPRVLVGRKGSGKTFYLRLMEDASKKRNDVYCFEHNNEVPPLSLLLKFTAQINQIASGAMWQKLWRRAIMLSLATLFYSKGKSKSQQDFVSGLKLDTNQFLDDFDSLFFDYEFNRPLDIFSAASLILRNFHTQRHLDNILNNVLWTELESELSDLLGQTSTVAIYLDTFDNDLRYAPATYIECQKGLFYSLMNLLDHAVLRQVHITITLRDIVFSSIAEGEHGRKYATNKHILSLDWDEAAASFYLKSKVRGLSPVYLVNQNASIPTIEDWVGRDAVSNDAYSCVESVVNYLMRHSNFTPRDINILGNRICFKVARRLARGEEFSEELLKEVVNREGIESAREMVATTANFLSASRFPIDTLVELYDVDRDEIAEAIPADDTLQSIEYFVKSIGKAAFGYEELADALTEYYKRFQYEATESKFHLDRIETACWQQGIIGYRHQRESAYSDDIFHGSQSGNEFRLPARKECYVFHPGIIDRYELERNSDRPVGGRFRYGGD